MAASQRRWTVIAGATPLIPTGLLYVHVAAVRLFLGQLPDPDRLPQPLHAWNLFALLTVFAMYPLAVVALLGLVLSIRLSLRNWRNPSVAFLIGVVCATLLLALDLGGG